MSSSGCTSSLVVPTLTPQDHNNDAAAGNNSNAISNADGASPVVQGPLCLYTKDHGRKMCESLQVSHVGTGWESRSRSSRVHGGRS